jgi:hypothetical protein
MVLPEVAPEVIVVGLTKPLSEIITPELFDTHSTGTPPLYATEMSSLAETFEVVPKVAPDGTVIESVGQITVTGVPELSEGLRKVNVVGARLNKSEFAATVQVIGNNCGAADVLPKEIPWS